MEMIKNEIDKYLFIATHENLLRFEFTFLNKRSHFRKESSFFHFVDVIVIRL